MVAEKNPEIRKAVNTLYKLSADDKVRAEYEQRQKTWRDRMSMVDYALEKGLQEGLQETARNLKVMGDSVEKIALVTGLTEAQIREL